MENNSEKTIWDGVLGLAMFVAAIMLYFKTAQVMTVFAPSTMFGYTGLEVLFGNVSALLVEGIILALHFIPSMQNDSAKVFKWFLFSISAFCQVVDGFVVQNTLSQQPESIRFLVSWGVPLIPTLIFLGLLIIGVNHGKAENRVRKPSKPFKGVRTMWREFIDGSNGKSVPENPVYASEDNQEKLDEPKQNKQAKLRQVK
jgi:hypothetical protein